MIALDTIQFNKTYGYEYNFMDFLHGSFDPQVSDIVLLQVEDAVYTQVLYNPDSNHYCRWVLPRILKDRLGN